MKKNKLHNPQIVPSPIPETISDTDIGRIWVDKVTHKFKIALFDSEQQTPIIRDFLDDSHITQFDNKYYTSIEEGYFQIVAQVSGDKHFDNGYDFFNDTDFLNNASQDTQDYFSYFYREVSSTSDNGYLRTISTTDGSKHIRTATGNDIITIDGVDESHVKYSKINLGKKVKSIVSIMFQNKDELVSGFELNDEKDTILIYADPDGVIIGKTVKIKYIV